MSMSLRAKAGLTIIEVVVIMSIGALIVAVSAKLLMRQVSLRQSGIDGDVLDNVMRLNLAEIEAEPLSASKTPGRCWVRYYDRDGKYQSSPGDYPLTHVMCTDPYPDPAVAAQSGGVIKITTSVLKLENMSIEFDPAQFLKLPQYVPTQLRALRLRGGYMPAQGGQGVTRSVTLFKKARS